MPSRRSQHNVLNCCVRIRTLSFAKWQPPTKRGSGHVAQMLPRLALNGDERREVFRLLLSYLNDDSSIVRTFAMQALADIAASSPALLPAARQHIADLTVVGTAAMKARGRKLLAGLGGLTARSAATRRRRTR